MATRTSDTGQKCHPRNAVFRPSKQKDVTLATALLSDAKQEIRYQSLDPATAQQQRHEHSLQIEAERVRNMNTRRSISQALTRVSIMRDRLVRGLIPGLVTNARNPLPFNTDQFSMDVGKVTNMSAVSTAFQFPSEFIVPPDAPDERTTTSNVTALAYQFIRYKSNIYYWSPSNPPGQESAVITLLMFYANAEQY